LLNRQQEKASMKLVTTSLAVGALVMSLAGAAVAQTSLDPGAQGGAKAGAGMKTQTDRAKTGAGAGGSATTGAGAHTQGGSAGAAGSVSGQGSAAGSAGGGTSGSMGATPGATGKPRGTGTLGN
jgi:hypothetical protein